MSAEATSSVLEIKALVIKRVEILGTKVEQGFRPGAVPDEIIQKIASHVADKSGDCRQALEILLQEGRKPIEQEIQNLRWLW